MTEGVIYSGLDLTRFELWTLAAKFMAAGVTSILSVLFIIFVLSLRTPNRRERRSARHFTLASLFATVFIDADAAIHASAVVESVDHVLVPYRLALSAIPVSAAGFVNLSWSLDPERAPGRAVSLGLYAGVVLVAALVWIDHPLLIIASDDITRTGTAVYANYGASAPAFFALCMVLLAVMCRGLVPLARRIGGATVWRLSVAGFVVLFASGLYDVLRELGVLASPINFVSLGYVFFQASTFAVLAIHYSRTLEDREKQGLQLRRLTDAVVRDSHSGLFMRCYLEDILNTLGKTARGGLLFIDLDDFKAVNDNYGHAAGDAFISAVAQRIRVGLREGDIACRWGGDEFVVYLPGTDAQTLRMLAERLQQTLGALQLLPITPAKISVSIGCAELDDGDWRVTLQRADRAMYEAKQAGRDRLVFASPSMPGKFTPSAP